MKVARANMDVAAVNGKLYAIGGTLTDVHAPLSINEEYDPANDSWTFKTPMPTERCMFAVVVYRNKIYCIGGVARINGSIRVTGLNQVYDPATDSWGTKTPMPTPRSFITANVIDGKICVMGGMSDKTIGGVSENDNSIVNVNEVYDPANDSWTTKACMSIGTTMYASASVDNKNIHYRWR